MRNEDYVNLDVVDKIQNYQDQQKQKREENNTEQQESDENGNQDLGQQNNQNVENLNQQNLEENNGSAGNSQSNQNGWEINNVEKKVIDAYDKADGKPDEFKKSMQNIFGQEFVSRNFKTIDAGFKAIKSTCGNKFDEDKMEELDETIDAWNEFKALCALIYNYTIGLVAGQYDRTTKQDKNDYRNFVLLEINRQNLEEFNETKRVLNF